MVSASSTDRNHDAAIYRSAAANMEAIEFPGVAYRSPYSCDQIGHACGWFPDLKPASANRKYLDLRGRYTALFSPNESGSGYWHEWEDATNERILALCFMAAMVEAGDA